MSPALLFAFLASVANAEDTKELVAFRVAGEPPRIDGRVDDDTWRQAAIAQDLVQSEPANMEAPTERTTVQVAYDDRNLYVAVRCLASDPSQITAGLGRRDNLPRSDRITLRFDPRHDHQTGYAFEVNPSGVQGDYTLYDDTSVSGDYDAVWDVETAMTAEGWTAELRIPLSQMRFSAPSDAAMVWGFNVQRDIHRKGESDMWVATPRGTRGVVSRFGHLVFRERFSPPRRLEILPFGLGRTARPPGAPSSQSLDGGFDLRYGLGTSSTLSATVNPDFGQVEQDPAVLNLSVFETQFAERRPFFLEDSRILVPPYGQFPDFYSPRIGRAPGRIPLPAEDRLLDKPDRTRILGAAKLTGKKSGWTYGLLTALTAREHATVESTLPGTERLIEPQTSYNVARVQRDILGSTSNVGLIATGVVREQDLDAFTGGVDGTFRWDENRYVWNGHAVWTHAPVAGELRNGFGSATNFSYESRHLQIAAHLDHFSRHFRNADMGFLTTRPHKTDGNLAVTLAQPDPWRIFRRLSTGLFADEARTGDGLVIARAVSWNASAELRSFWSADLSVTHDLRRYSDLDTRGGPPIEIPADTGVSFSMSTDSRKSWTASVFTNAARDVVGGWGVSASPSLRLQPSARLQAQLAVGFDARRDRAQWITNRDTDGDGTIDHVFGEIRRTVVDIQARGTYAFSRDMTLEIFLQPFVSVGRYSDIKRLARPSSFEFTPVTIPEDPDFNNKSLQSNVVFRWEYRRGSTLYLVWNVSNSDDSRPGEFSPLRDLRSGFGAGGTQVLMVKFNYWLGL